MNKSIIVFLGLCFLMATPNTSSAQLKKFIQEKKDKLAKMAGKPTSAEKAARLPRETHGFTSDLHKKYVNQIVFSNEVIDFKEEDESKFISTYKITDPLWLRVYMDNSLMNYMLSAPESKEIPVSKLETYSAYNVTFYLNGKEILSEKDGNGRFDAKEKGEWTTFKGSFSCKEANVFYFSEFDFKTFLIKAETDLTPGTHDFKMVVEPMYYYKGVSNGRDEVKFVADKKIVGKLKLVVDGPIVDKTETKICLPNPVMRDVESEKTFLKVFNEAAPDFETFDQAIIVYDKWMIAKNEYTGFPVKKYIHAVIPFRRDGKCFKREYSFIQDFDGVEYGKMYVRTAGRKKAIPCACLEE